MEVEDKFRDVPLLARDLTDWHLFLTARRLAIPIVSSLE